MFKIGEFARLSGVSAKSLRHYDGLGLFRPVWVNPANGYRFYSPAQLPELYRIVALKDLGIPLHDVAELVVGGADLSAVLERRRTELEMERAALDRRLAALDIRVDVEGRSAHPDVVTRKLGSELVGGVRVRLGPGEDLEPVFNEIEAHVRDLGVRAARPPQTIVHAQAPDGSRDVEPVVPLTRRMPEHPRISCWRLPAAQVAAVIHRGPYDGLVPARDSLSEWIRASDLTVSGPLRIVYLQFGADPSLEVPGSFLTESANHFVTELQQPYRSAGLERLVVESDRR